MTKRKRERPTYFEGHRHRPRPQYEAATAVRVDADREFIAKHEVTIRDGGREFNAEPVDGLPGYIKAGKPKRPARRKRA